ncbi:MAG TPA: undecaprenyl-diphosphate phosphatase [Candidatus Binatia bacterium]|nr:undecaprenyl-diphosphate phosphatase [Candidatus Binatia bacterium]
MTFAQAMFLAALQGVSELFPISSLGHTVLIPALLHWKIARESPQFLSFVVALHLGTALALVVFYRTTWKGIITAFVRSVVRGRFDGTSDEKTAWLLIAGTIPVALLGVYFESTVRSLFASPLPVSLFLVANGAIMFLGERLRRAQHAGRGKGYRVLEEISWLDGALIGLSQGLALLPGISRSGTSIVAGLLADLDHESAARFSFLLATPVILAASVVEVPLLFTPSGSAILTEALAGGALSGIVAYASVAFLTKYFESNDLRPFGWYCLVVGAVCAVLFATKVIA